MLAAVGGLAYALSSVLRLQSYVSYILPMPIVVAAVRRGAGAGRKTCIATTILLTGDTCCCSPPPPSFPVYIFLLAAQTRRAPSIFNILGVIHIVGHWD